MPSRTIEPPEDLGLPLTPFSSEAFAHPWPFLGIGLCSSFLKIQVTQDPSHRLL